MDAIIFAPAVMIQLTKGLIGKPFKDRVSGQDLGTVESAEYDFSKRIVIAKIRLHGGAKLEVRVI